MRPHLLLGETVERLAHQLEVLAEVPRPLVAARRGQHRRLALRPPGKRTAGVAQPGSTPQSASRPATLPGEVGHHVGHERSGDGRLDVPLLAVVEGGPGRAHRGRGVGEVVRDDLVGVDPAASADGRRGLIDELLGQVDRGGGAGEVGGRGRSHGARP